GTAYFPFIYATALQSGMLPTHRLEDEPMDNRSVMVSGREGILGEWGMEVIKPRYEGRITLRRGLEASKIAATVRLVDKIGLEQVAKRTSAYGLPMEDVELLRRLAVGFEPCSLKQLTRAMAVFGEGGVLADEGLIYLDKIENARGEVVYERKAAPRSPTRVVDEVTAFQVHDMLVGGARRGSAKGLYEGMPEDFHGTGKGGTTHDFGDTWFAGYNSELSCGVWTGFLNSYGEAIHTGAFSRDLAMPVWKAAMRSAHASFAGKPVEMPESVVAEKICAVSGQRPTQYCREYVKNPETGVEKEVSTVRVEYFRRQNNRVPYCQVHAGADPNQPEIDINDLDAAVVDAVPVRPKSSVLIGDDPYHADLPSFALKGEEPAFVPRKASVLDSFDLSRQEERLKLPRPGRLIIFDR
ncbi:MAG: penicillin-binding transpeptidase domain-containing protein, partial [Akkermansiaceae bacterium]|nr:penicillin-binding transpeptidase domain-containing protein [Akkermansiaceae bacterium]